MALKRCKSKFKDYRDQFIKDPTTLKNFFKFNFVIKEYSDFVFKFRTFLFCFL